MIITRRVNDVKMLKESSLRPVKYFNDNSLFTTIFFMIKIVRVSHSASPHPLNEWFWYVGDSETKCKEGGAPEILDHRNTIEPGVIVFTKENRAGDVLPVLDLKHTVHRKTKKEMYSVHYKKTRTNINVKKGPITQKV